MIVEETQHGSHERYVDATIAAPTKKVYVAAPVKFTREQLIKTTVRLGSS